MVRFKNRYLLIQLIYGEAGSDLSSRFLYLHSPNTEINDLSALFSVKYYSPTTSNLILRCKRDQVNKVRASLLFINQINPQISVIFNVAHVSGTIRKTQCFLIEWDRQQTLSFDQP
ncbi:hypothetical protein PSHT_11919 [Puccinia striiformis]|uniref:Uncharacterized protein n=1 Tax=Puccinia striiformis TaxID=27350 RepID=A0A2S4V061_9BASI|nr:hypothetical protein PSHT_11919 [Puccinia striiformis]